VTGEPRDGKAPRPASEPPPAPTAGAAGAADGGSDGGASRGGVMLEMRGVHAGYGRIDVLHGIDLLLGKTEVLVVLGPNGAGKSTLLKVASAQLRPRAGSVMIGGRVVGRTRTEKLVREGLCAIPEGRGVFPNLTVEEHLRMWTYRGGVARAAITRRAFERFPALADRRTQLAGTLSGGEQQMLAVTRALCPGVNLLLLDELSMGLAPLVVAELYAFVAELAASGVTVLVVEQFAQVALAVATRAAVLVEGRIVLAGSPEEAADAAAGAYLALSD
jgi:branched-chain amino acid transport system ATP-binding protein